MGNLAEKSMLQLLQTRQTPVKSTERHQQNHGPTDSTQIQPDRALALNQANKSANEKGYGGFCLGQAYCGSIMSSYDCFASYCVWCPDGVPFQLCLNACP